ncbi:synaptosomal-associated protein 25 isoform X1 [Lucilia sericata]|uniref:synaptosomal-associated protein 25 isoform X1 n=1 Tax=Lucilia sericata TaxID=13632 RepID=UPI0018A87E1F|nr:synaptosomal-associated protein 25 isoform X1 [Lucilia sericata]
MANNTNSRPTELEELEIQAIKVADESLESTRRMLNMMEESEQAGQKTMEALDEQGEKLNNIERGMDNINADMTKAEKTLKRLKRCCFICPTPWRKVPTQVEPDGELRKETEGNAKVVVDQPRRVYDERTVNSSANPSSGYITRITNDAREDEMDSNLCQVNNILGTLRNMAVDMNSDLTKQNTQIERITAKGDANSVRLDQVNISANKMINS